jgi:hypothetical protein
MSVDRLSLTSYVQSWREEDGLGKVTAFTIEGLDLWFNSNDHLPPHFHAGKSGCWEVRVFIVEEKDGEPTFEKNWPRDGSGPARQDRDAILKATKQHRVALLEEWERKVLTDKEKG